MLGGMDGVVGSCAQANPFQPECCCCSAQRNLDTMYFQLTLDALDAAASLHPSLSCGWQTLAAGYMACTHHAIVTADVWLSRLPLRSMCKSTTNLPRTTAAYHHLRCLRPAQLMCLRILQLSTGKHM